MKAYITIDCAPRHVVGIHTVSDEDEINLEFLQGQVDGNIERVSLPKLEALHVDMYVNEEYLLDAEPKYNYFASRLANEQNGIVPTKENGYGYMICGKAVIVGNTETPDGIESAWLDDGQVDAVLAALKC